MNETDGGVSRPFAKLVKPCMPLHLEDVFYGTPQGHKKPPKWVTHKGAHLHMNTGSRQRYSRANEINKATQGLTQLSGIRPHHKKKKRWSHPARERDRQWRGERDGWLAESRVAYRKESKLPGGETNCWTAVKIIEQQVCVTIIPSLSQSHTPSLSPRYASGIIAFVAFW